MLYVRISDRKENKINTAINGQCAAHLWTHITSNDRKFDRPIMYLHGQLKVY